MTSVKNPQPVLYLNGFNTHKSPEQTVQCFPKGPLNNSREENNLSDSDIDGLSTARSVLLSARRLQMKTPEPPENEGNSLMQWLMQHFQQNGSENGHQAARTETDSDNTSRNTEAVAQNGDLYSVSQALLPTAEETSHYTQSAAERWAKSCPGLDRVKPSNNLHFPRMVQSPDTNPRKLKDSVNFVNQMFDKIQQKTEGLKSENYRISQKLEEAIHIIGDMKHLQLQSSPQVDRWAKSTTALAQPRKKETPVLRLKRLNNTKMSSSQSLLSRSAYPDSGLNHLERSVTELNDNASPTVKSQLHGQRSEVRSRANTPPPLSWKERINQYDGVQLRPVQSRRQYPMTRRYSSAQQYEAPRRCDEYRESSLGPFNTDQSRSSNGNGNNGTTGVLAKISRIGHALRQRPHADKKGRQFADSQADSKHMDHICPEIHGRLSPPNSGTKNFSTLIRRPFRRKAVTPSPGLPVTSPSVSLEETQINNRSVSLMHLNGVQTPFYAKTKEEDICTMEPVQVRAPRKNVISIIRKISPDRFNDVSSRSNGKLYSERSPTGVRPHLLPKFRKKRDVDLDLGVYSYETSYRY